MQIRQCATKPVFGVHGIWANPCPTGLSVTLLHVLHRGPTHVSVAPTKGSAALNRIGI